MVTIAEEQVKEFEEITKISEPGKEFSKFSVKGNNKTPIFVVKVLKENKKIRYNVATLNSKYVPYSRCFRFFDTDFEVATWISWVAKHIWRLQEDEKKAGEHETNTLEGVGKTDAKASVEKASPGQENTQQKKPDEPNNSTIDYEIPLDDNSDDEDYRKPIKQD